MSFRAGGEHVDLRRMIDDDLKRRVDVRELYGALCAVAADDRRRHQHAAYAGLHQRLGFAQFGAAHAYGAGVDLQLCDVRRLVALRVRAQAESGASGALRHDADVAFQCVQLEHERRRGKLVT